IVGTSIGTNAAIVPLTLAAIPFIGRVVESALKEVDYGLIEAAQAMGASPRQIITKVLIPEALPAIIMGLTLAIIGLIGYSAMAGAIGGGGLGDLAIRYGYQRFRGDIMLLTVIILIAQVQIVQTCGDYFARRLNKR
ncbi:MAG: ABC transporter permease subunit, partial [Veillonellales bacterium]